MNDFGPPIPVSLTLVVVRRMTSTTSLEEDSGVIKSGPVVAGFAPIVSLPSSAIHPLLIVYQSKQALSLFVNGPERHSLLRPVIFTKYWSFLANCLAFERTSESLR